jgi:uncharacterized protein DUF6265
MRNASAPARLCALTLVVAVAAAMADAQQRAPAESPKTSDAPGTSSLDSLAWLEGCWRGAVNQREFREHWLPLRGGMLIGASHTIVGDKTQDYEYLRLETRPGGVYYVALPSGKSETAFKLASVATDDGATIFTFANTVDDFPQRIVYRRGSEGWLYASVEGKLRGEDRTVTYPMRRVGCESGEFILK